MKGQGCSSQDNHTTANQKARHCASGTPQMSKVNRHTKVTRTKPCWRYRYYSLSRSYLCETATIRTIAATKGIMNNRQIQSGSDKDEAAIPDFLFIIFSKKNQSSSAIILYKA
jgi:hypothetical protein